MSKGAAKVSCKQGSKDQDAAKIINLDKLLACGGAPEEASRTSLPSDDLSEDERRELEDKAARLPPMMHPSGSSLASTAGPVTALPSASFAYVTFDGNKRSICAGNAEKPDMALAVGDERQPYRVMQVNNACIALYKPTGQGKAELKPGYPKPMSALFSRQGIRLLDPRAFYDWKRGRYIIVAVERAANNIDSDDGSYWIAVSKDANGDPGGDYYVYRIPMPSGGKDAFPDFPRLGQDKDMIYIASNKFDTTTDKKTYLYEEWLRTR